MQFYNGLQRREQSVSKHGRLKLFACALWLAIALVSPAADRRPNVIFIMADDLGWGELGCYGQKVIRTPRIDQLASQGLRFTQFYSGHAVCAPSRCALMTGMHTGHAYIRNNGNPQDLEALKQQFGWEFPGQHPIPADSITVTKLFKEAGYATGAMGKWGLGHVGTTGDPARHGFDLFYGYYCQVHAHNHYPKFLWRNQQKELLPGNSTQASGATYSQDRFVEEAVRFIHQHREQPFFLYLPFIVPHLSIQVPDASVADYRDQIVEEEYKHTSYLKHATPRAAYAAMVTHMDRGIGKILDSVRDLGLEEDTLVVFTSDNGPTYDRLGGTDSKFFNSAGELRGLKGSLYEGGIRVPLIVRWPNKIRAGATTEWSGAHWDFMPTLCSLAQLPCPREIDGLDFSPLLLGEAQAEHPFLYWESPGYGSQQAARLGKWKAVRQQMQQAKRDRQPVVTELYDLASDPNESKNVAHQHPNIVARLEQVMAREHRPSSLFPLPGID